MKYELHWNEVLKCYPNQDDVLASSAIVYQEDFATESDARLAYKSRGASPLVLAADLFVWERGPEGRYVQRFLATGQRHYSLRELEDGRVEVVPGQWREQPPADDGSPLKYGSVMRSMISVS